MEVVNGEGGKAPIINCHTHIFIGDHVPPYLAKTFVPSPLHKVLPLSAIVGLFRAYYKGPYTWPFKSSYKQAKRGLYKVKVFIQRKWLIRILAFLLVLWLTVHVFFILFAWLSMLISPDASGGGIVKNVRQWMEAHSLLALPDSDGWKLVMVLVVIIFVQTGRNLILFLFKKLFRFLSLLPGPQSKELIKRYITIGRFSFHKEQVQNYLRLRNQYPENTGFVVLPMDMEFMEAGTLKKGFHYRNQMEELAKIKANPKYEDKFFPFVFVDPRRIEIEDDYFRYKQVNNTVELESCFVKSYIEDKAFSGFKIYPALGYYPFDERLLPLWKYAADNGLPIITHCIRGNIFYRGAKRKGWDFHPVFQQASGDGVYEPMLLHQIKNIDFINNFTHPLNYACLLKEPLLRICVGRSDEKTQQLFGYESADKSMKHDLHHLKLCFGHYGGADEWAKFLELDRDNHSSQLVRQPGWGIDFLTDDEGTERKGKPEQIWKHADWYSIISSLMLQHPNVYSDLSFIIYDNAILPLLNTTMQNDKLKHKVLFGTDFYVVRNHKSEKHILADLFNNVSDQQFDLMARINPRAFLENKLHGKVKI